MSTTDTVVIVGASHAAAELAPTLRKKGWEGKIVLIGDENILPYQRPPLSKAYYKGDLEKEKLLIKSEAAYEKAEVELKLGTRVTKIEPEEHLLTLDSGEKLQYTKLILATGTRARQIPVEGADLPCIHYLRTLVDVDNIKSMLGEGSRLLIVGAGYIGLELAASASAQGIKSTVLEAQERVLARVTSPVISEFYQNYHAEQGVDIRLAVGLSKFQSNGDTYQAVLSDGSTIDFDCAVVGIGVIPNIELAEEAGLACDNGIVVDEFAQTSDPDIYAVGDVANHPSPLYGRRIRLESVPNAVDQSKAAVSAICGDKQVYDSVPWFWSDQYGIKLQTVGLLTDYDEYVVRGSVDDLKFAVFYLQQGRLIAADCINSPAEFMMTKKLVAAKAAPDAAQLADAGVPLKSLL